MHIYTIFSLLLIVSLNSSFLSSIQASAQVTSPVLCVGRPLAVYDLPGAETKGVQEVCRQSSWAGKF